MIISHLYNDGEWHLQSNEEHQRNVAELARSFGADFGCGDICYAMGMIHDEGKKQIGFQRYIKRVSGYDPEDRSTEHPNHAYIGAQLSKQLMRNLQPLPCYVICSHHSGLKNSSYYLDIPDMPKDSLFEESLCSNLPKTSLQLKGNPDNKDFHHLFRMCFSCIVDADFLDTEKFMHGGHSRNEILGHQNSLTELLKMLEDYLSYLTSSSPKSPINELRFRISDVCRESGNSSEQGFYSLTVPTGGGKTLSGLLWALKHAVNHNLKRIIIAIPYTSIIVQTAGILKKIFGENNVLEHHSAINIYEDNKDDNFVNSQRLASENWDYPIIVTTNVQLFESMMSSVPSKCRKLHNIAKSVIILDEAQMLPVQFLQPILDTLDTYRRLFSCSILLSTASQPVLNGEILKTFPDRGNGKLRGLQNVSEIIPSEMNLCEELRRVDLHFDTEDSNCSQIAERMLNHKKVLCIVNTRKAAIEIFSHLPEEEGNFHLSKLMCSAHISDELKKIRIYLQDPSKTVRVVSTQLIEAGVDVDFPVVMRQEAGLDSILQASGRCNREGRDKRGNTYVFKFGEPLPSGYISNTNNARKSMSGKYLNDADSNWFSPQVINDYFLQLYSRTASFDSKNINSLLYDPRDMQFEEAAIKFRLIAQNGHNVIVNYGGSDILINELKTTGKLSYRGWKLLLQYSVNLYDRDFDNLMVSGNIQEVCEGLFYIPKRDLYSNTTGIVLDSADEILLI